MKLIINISDRVYEKILKNKGTDKSLDFEEGLILEVAVENATLLEEKTGFWKFQKREGNECIYRCSNCGRKITKYDGTYDFERLFAYCPECGIKMKEK